MKKIYKKPIINQIKIDKLSSLIMMSKPGNGPPDWLCKKRPCLKVCGGPGCGGKSPSSSSLQNSSFSDNPFS